MKVFQKVRDNLYKLGEDNIIETTFPPEKVEADLEPLFKEVRLCTLEPELNISRGRVFFVCQA